MRFYNGNTPATRIRWTAPTTREDGSAYAASTHRGYVLGVSDPGNPNDGIRAHVSVPAAYDVSEWPLDQLNITEPGDYEAALATVDSDGQQGAWSSPFAFEARLAPPSPPTGLTVF